MDFSIGITGKDFVLMAADCSAGRSIVLYQTEADKILVVDKYRMMAMSGPVGDRTNFCEYIQKNAHLYELRNRIPLTTHGLANFTRTELAQALRSNPYQVDLLIGGFDQKKEEASLYYLDYLASMQKVKFGAHGYGSNFTLSIMDRYWKQDLTLEDAKEILRRCITELKKRFLINMPVFKTKVVDKDGVRQITLFDGAEGEKEKATQTWHSDVYANKFGEFPEQPTQA